MGHHHKRVVLPALLQCVGQIIVRLAPVFIVEAIAHHFLMMTFSRNRRVDFVTWMLVAGVFNLLAPGFLPMPGSGGGCTLLGCSGSHVLKIVLDFLHVLRAWVEVRFLWFCVSLLLAYGGRANYNQFHKHSDSPLLLLQAHLMAFAGLFVSLTFTDQRSGSDTIPASLCTAVERMFRRTRSTCSFTSLATSSSSDSSINTVMTDDDSIVSGATRRVLRQFKSDLAHKTAQNVSKQRVRSQSRTRQPKKRPLSQGRPSSQGRHVSKGRPSSQGRPLSQGRPSSEGRPSSQGRPLSQGRAPRS